MEIQRNVISKSVENRPIFCEIFSNRAHNSDTILILASIHGNEHVGTPLLQNLADHLRDHPELLAGRRVILVSEANPDGAFHQQRHNAHGIDLNRNFPAKNWNDQTDHGAKPLSEPESRALHALINKYKPNRIVTLHQPLNCMDYDGPAEAKALAEAMSAGCDLQVKKVGALDGSLGSFAGETLHIPIITVEFDAEINNASKEELWQRYGQMLLTAIQFKVSPRP
jgi:protein MpaA